MQVTFLSWNFTEARRSWTERIRGWLWETVTGNFWILLRTGPQTTGTFLMTVSEAMRISHFLAHFLMTFLSLLCFSSAIMQILRLGRGMLGSLTVPTKRLSFYG